MKKFILLVTCVAFCVVGIMSCDTGSDSTSKGNSDPGTNFSGIWIYTEATSYSSYKHEISEMSGEWWLWTPITGWYKEAEYSIIWDGSGYMATNIQDSDGQELSPWTMSLSSSDILTVGTMTYSK